MKGLSLFFICLFISSVAFAQRSSYGRGDWILHRTCSRYGEIPLREDYWPWRIIRCAYCIPPCPVGSTCRNWRSNYVCCRRPWGPYSTRQCSDNRY